MDFIIEGAQLVMRGGLREGSVRIRNGRIEEIVYLGAGAHRDDTKVPRVDGRDCILSSGFIDVHCHGGDGFDVNDGTDEALHRIGNYHFSHGVTSYLPTLSVDPMPTLERAMEAARRARGEDRPGCAEVLGTHFESPYINPRYKGCQAAERLLPFDSKALSFIEKNADLIKRVTLAPELPGVMESIPHLRDLGIIISGGHSDADAATFRAAADRGMTMATHLYNAMSSVRKDGPFRVPGVLEAALTDDRIYTELIADGHHVPKELLTIAHRCKGQDRFLLCSDASRAAGYGGAKTLFICGQEAIVENGVAMLKDRSSLASSATALDGMIRFLVHEVGIPMYEALRAASTIPAAAIGVADRKGSIAPGYDADLVLLDRELYPRAVWNRGQGGFLEEQKCH